jgi:hypothetical protein
MGAAKFPAALAKPSRHTVVLESMGSEIALDNFRPLPVILLARGHMKKDNRLS